MTEQEFFNQFNEAAESLQSEALQLTNDLDEARELYQETAHHALKNKQEVADIASFRDWASKLMQNLFHGKTPFPTFQKSAN